MDDGILDIALLPAWSPSSVKAALTAALSRATRLQAGIALWTIDAALLGPDLVRAIQHENGFVCVDLHPPTEVEPLAALARQGGRVHVYYEDIPTYTLGAQVTLTSAGALAAEMGLPRSRAVSSQRLMASWALATASSGVAPGPCSRAIPARPQRRRRLLGSRRR